MGHNWFTPIDICRAMEMEPLCINGYAQIMAVTLGLEEGGLRGVQGRRAGPRAVREPYLQPGRGLEGVAFHRLMRDEMKKRVAQGQGFIPQENYRVMFVGLPAAYDADFINWMQVEKGISVVSEPGISHYLGWEPDYSKPLESLARCRTYTTCWAMQGPLKEMWIPDAVAAAREYHVDGVMCWPARGCRQYPAALRAVADAIKREVGIPVVMMVDSDFNDPFFVSAEELMDNVEKALEIIDKK